LGVCGGEYIGFELETLFLFVGLEEDKKSSQLLLKDCVLCSSMMYSDDKKGRKQKSVPEY
jgi:hypothetical protein